MSQTAELTPYDAEEIERQRMAREHAEATSRERLAARRQARLRERSPELTETAQVPLNIGSLNTLADAASKLGYRKAELSESRVRLEREGGEFIELRRRGRKTEMIARGGVSAVEEIVRQHTIDRTIEHCQKRGLDVRIRKLANGELQIEAVKGQQNISDSPAKLEMEVRNDGRLAVDIKCVAGNACEEIVSDLAQSVGATTGKVRHKPEFFQRSNQVQRLKQKL